MDREEVSSSVVSGFISLVIALVATFAVSIVFPTGNLEWAMTAVGFASFFSGFFSSYFN